MKSARAVLWILAALLSAAALSVERRITAYAPSP